MRHLLISHESLGRVYEILGGRENLKKAAEQYRQSLETAEKMAEELKTEESLKTLSTSYEKLGGCMRFWEAGRIWRKQSACSDRALRSGSG